MPLSPNARGSLFMAGSMAGFATNDGFMKFVFESLPFFQSVFIRGMFTTLLVAGLAWRAGAFKTRLTRADTKPLVLRCIGEIGATLCFLSALHNMPLTNANAIMQGAPLAVTMAAALFLKEPVGWRRWLAITVGFVGVMIIVRPGTEGFDAFALFAVAAVLFVTLRDLATRQMPAGTSTLLVSTITAFAITVVAAVVAPFQGLQVPTMEETGLLFCAGVFLLMGYVFGVSAMRVGDISAVSPFRYTVLLWALVIGYIWFGEVPDELTIIGATIVVAAGLYTLWREQMVAGRRPAAHAAVRPFEPSDDDARTPPR
ncbi:MAG: DMT family transporter [Devosia sp.]